MSETRHWRRVGAALVLACLLAAPLHALAALAERGEFDQGAVAEAAAKYKIDDPQAAGPQTSDIGVA